MNSEAFLQGQWDRMMGFLYNPGGYDPEEYRDGWFALGEVSGILG